MDSSIRTLLSTAQSIAGPENPPLHQAFGILKNVAENKPSIDTPEAFGQDLYVLCAELAFQNGLMEMSKDCLKMFFMKPPPGNQFLCRAYLCQAQLLAPQDANNPEQLEKAVVYLLKAISFAKKNPRYHFLVYNASVIYWQMCRPFLKTNYKQYLARSLHQVVKALDDIDDQDFEWRAQLMIALMECHLDANKRTDASSIAGPAATFIKNNVPHLYKKVFGIIVRNQLLDSSKLHKDIKNSPELSIYYKILKLKVSLDQGEQREYYSEIQRILNQIGIMHSGIEETSSAKTDGGKKKATKGRQASPSSAKGEENDKSRPGSRASDKSEKPELTRKSSQSRLRSASKAGGRRTPTPTSNKKLAEDSQDKPFLLLELARLCLELDYADLAQDCVDHMKTCVVRDQGFYLELELLQCELMVKSLGEKQESYQRNVIDVRLQALKRCEETIMNAIRLRDPNVIQAACVTQWNLCLPLLQPNLRHYVRKPLTLVAQALEDIQSLLIPLRCQVHTELAKCEEDQEQIQVGMENLTKALALDDSNIYRERLEVALKRLELRSQLYKQPERAEDQAAMIIEQARKADSGTMRMKRSLLVKAGEALAPDAFLLVLDSESDTKDVSGGKAPLTQIKKLANKARQFNKCVQKAEGHLKRLGDENDRERARLWGDLAKTARKQEVWDVCRVAARFCLLYDDGRWKNVIPEKKMESPKPGERRKEGGAASSMGSAPERAGNESSMKVVQESVMSTMPKESVMTTVAEGSSYADTDGKKLPGRPPSRPSSPDKFVPLYDKDLIRMLAEVQFIQGEADVHLLRSEGIELNDMPIPPVDKSKRPKGYVAKKPEEDPDWIEYCDWIKSLTNDATSSFLRGLELGIELVEPWLVCSAASYIWNYNNHVLTQLRHREIIATLATVVEGLKKVGHAGETVMLVNICNALAYSYMKPWIPAPKGKDEEAVPTPVISPDPGKKGKASPSKQPKPATNQVVIDPESAGDLKKAIEVCEYAIDVTNGYNSSDVVPIGVRTILLQTWVHARQMAQQQVPKTLGADDDSYADGQRQMSRAIVALEMISVNRNGIMEFKDTPSILEVANWIEECSWSDKFMELQMWTRLTYLSFLHKQHALVLRCSKKALHFAVVGTQPKNRKMEVHRYMVEQEMLSYASALQGQSLVENMAGKNAIRREALEAFLNSARYAANAENYEMVMTAARHYWNTCVPLVSQPIERELLREPIKAILSCITETAEIAKKTEEKEEESEEDSDAEEGGGGGGGEGGEGGKPPADDKEASASGAVIGSPEDDLTLRASLYGVLFQSYADKKQYEEGLQAMDQAIADMPRTKHRLLIFKHRVMTKAKLGKSINMDIQKFKDESEDYVAHMWRRVALNSKETLEQLISYQAAVEALSSVSNEWQKVDLLLEFGQWLYYNEFPLQDCVDQVEWAIDIMLNMRTETDIQKERVRYRSGSSSSGKRSSGKRKSSASSPTKKDKKGKTKGSAKPKPAPTPVPKPSQARAETPRKSPDPKKSARSVDTRSDASSDTDEINPEGYIPVAKQAIIGVLPNNPGLKMQDLEDPRQLDGLLRAYVLLAEIGGRSSPEYKDFLIMAHKILMRLWQVSVPQTGAIIKEIAKAQAAAAAGDGKSEKDSQKNKKDKKETSAPPVKERPKRKGPLDYLPSTTEEWAIYDVPDEVIEAFNHESMKVTGINHHTIVKPMLTMYYLDAMTTMMRDVGYSHLVLPVLALQELMSRDLLKNSALNVVVHGRAIEICTELNIKHGIKFHETLCGPIVLKEEDQAKSRDEIAVLKEKALQVIKEEQRVKESLAKLAEESAKRKSKSLTSRTAASMNTDKGEEKPIESHLGKVLGAVTFRDVWTDTAELLIKQTDYQGARVFLNEAFIAAQAFEDIALEARILMLFGKLSYREAQYGQAFNFCREAQSIHQGDEMFWYETTMIMADSTLMDYENRNAKRIARGILVHGINEFMRIGDERPNRGCVMQYILSTMEAKLAGIQASIIFEENPDINIPKVLTRLIAVCDRYESATEKMIRVGYFREVLPVMKDHASVLMKMAKQSVEAEKEIRHTYYLQAMKVIKEAVAISELVVRDVQTLTSLPEVRNLSLPVQRELADIKIKCGELLLEIFKEHSKEDRERQLEDLRKGTVVKMVEDYIRETPKYTHMEREWVETTTTVIEDAMLKFVDAHNLSVGIPRLRTEALCGLGRCLRAFSIFSSPNSPTQWIVNEEEMSKLSDDAGEGEEEGEEKAEFDEASKQFIRCTEQIKEIKALEDTSNHYLLQASEVLTQALNLALHHHFRDLAGVVSLELLECNGQYDPQFSSMFLALYQSCTTSLKAECLLKEAQLDPYTSQLAALLHQRDDILRSDLYTNMSAGSLLSAVNTSLCSWQAWKRLEVQPTHLDLLKEFPPNFNFIILQHSPDKNFLYGAILDKPKNVSGGGKNVKQNVPPATSRAKVFGVPVSPDVLDFLLERYADYKQATQQLLLKLEYQRAQVMMRQKMLENLDESLKQKTSHHHLDEEDAAEEAHLIAEFESVIKDMESYLGPITAQLQGILIPQTVTPASGKEAKNAPAEPPPSIEAAILLADRDLMQLPLEALGFLQVENVVSLSRDFSLQMFYHRYYREEVPAAKTEESAADKKKKAKTSQDNPMSRIPGLRDASKKNAKIVPLSRELQPWQQGVDTMNFRYIVDSNVDCAETEIHKPKEVFEKLMEEYENQFTPRWLGVFGTDHAPSVGEWEIYLTENSSFIFYGMERFLSFIPPSKLTALNIPDCNIVYILDLAQTSKSFTRQSKLDVLKSANVLALEKPVETAMLLSLTGVKCVMANQWHCTLQENAEKLQATMKDILDGGKTTGEAIRLLFTPYRRKKPEPEGEETAQGTESVKPPEEAKATPDPGEDGEKSVQESTQEDQDPEPERSWYNLVLYGLPNLIVTQLS